MIKDIKNKKIFHFLIFNEDIKGKLQKKKLYFNTIFKMKYLKNTKKI